MKLDDKIKENKYCIIVDAYSSGGNYAQHFKEIGLLCIHVQSSPNISKLVVNTFKSEDFVANYLYEGEDKMELLVKKLATYKPLFIISGFHSSVYLADKLGTKLNIPSNNSETTLTRMDKHRMHHQLADKGISHARSVLSDSLEDILYQYKNVFEGNKVVIKPSDSAGSDSVYMCHNEEDVKKAYLGIKDSYNVMGLKNDKVLIQEYLEGIEYIVNSVVYNGQHMVTDIWKSEKISVGDNGFIYDKTTLLSPDGDVQRQLIEYDAKVIQALDFKFGACHNEVIYTSRGPVLVEMNPRISGGHLPEIALKATDGGQILGVKQIIKNLLGYSNMNLITDYAIKKYACSVCLISKTEGIVESYQYLEVIKSLDSYNDMDLRVGIGEKIEKTVDVWTGPGMILLLSDDEEAIKKDYQRIREIEEMGIFDIEDVS